MTDLCDDGRFELIEKYKLMLMESTNISDSKDELKVLDTILFRFWQMGWLDKLEQPTVQQWIPCSEQEYPSDNREVDVTCEFTRYDGKKIRYTCRASYVHRYSLETTCCDWDGCDEYNEEDDTYYALPGWYERIHNWDDYSYCAIEDRVVAWRELSEPWNGEQK